jgi:HlyD family secretion protein
MTDPTDGVAANGVPTLTDRVKELRLAGKLDLPKAAGGTTWLPWLLCVLLAVGWAGFGIKWYRGSPAKTNEPAPDAATASSPGTSAAAKGETSDDTVALEVKGYLIPTQSIAISPIDVAGRVVELNIDEGLSFKKGDILAKIDATPYEAQLAEAKANMLSAKARMVEAQVGSRPQEIDQALAEVEDAKAQLEQYRREWARFQAQKTLSITAHDYEQAEAAYLTAKKRVDAKQKAYDLVKLGPRQERKDAAKADYEAAMARLKQAEWKLENCTIRSPVTGVILTKKAEIGSLINPVVGGVSTNLCDIADLRKLEVDLEVNERDISRVKLDAACRIRADAYPTRDYEGYVERMMPTANRAKSIVPVRIKVVPRDDEKQGQYLKPEMGVTVTFLNRVVDAAYKANVRKKLDDDSGASVTPKQ